MAINVVYGDTPGAGGLIANRLQSADQQAAQQKDLNYQQVQREADRQLQERMQKRQLKQQAILGGIQAGVGIVSGGASLLGAIPGIIEGFRDLSGPTARAQQSAIQSGNQDIQKAELGLRAAQLGAQITQNALAADRRDARLSESAAVGNSRMLSNVSADADKELFSRIQSGDADALDEGLRTKKFSYSPSLERNRKTWADQIEKIQADSNNYTPLAMQSAIAPLQKALDDTQFSVQPAPGAPVDKSAQFHSDVYTDGNGRKFQRNLRDGRWTPVIHKSEEAEIEVKKERELQEIKASDFGTQYDEAYSALAKANSTNPNRDDPAPTHDEVMAYLARRMEARKTLTAMMQPPQSMVQGIDPAQLAGGVAPISGVGGGMAFGGGVQPNPVGQPIAAMQSPQAPSPSPWKTVIQQGPLTDSLPSPGVQPEQVPAPAPDKPQEPAVNPLRPVSTTVQKSYDSSVAKVPTRPKIKVERKPLEAKPGNLAHAMGMTSITMESDGRSQLPVITDDDMLKKYADIMPAGTQFIWKDGKKYDLKAKAKAK
jgi:hypothetical protein